MPAPHRPHAPTAPQPAVVPQYAQQWQPQAPPSWLLPQQPEQMYNPPSMPSQPFMPFPSGDLAPLPTMNQLTDRSFNFGPPPTLQPDLYVNNYFMPAPQPQQPQPIRPHPSQGAVNQYHNMFASMPVSFSAGVPQHLAVKDLPPRPTSAPPATFPLDISLPDYPLENSSVEAVQRRIVVEEAEMRHSLGVTRPRAGRAVSGRNQEEAALQLLALKTGSSSAPNSPEKPMKRDREEVQEESFDISGGETTIVGDQEENEEDRPKKRTRILEHVLSSPPPSMLHFGTPLRSGGRGMDLFGDLDKTGDSQSAERSTYAPASSPVQASFDLFTSEPHYGMTTPAQLTFQGKHSCPTVLDVPLTIRSRPHRSPFFTWSIPTFFARPSRF